MILVKRVLAYQILIDLWWSRWRGSAVWCWFSVWQVQWTHGGVLSDLIKHASTLPLTHVSLQEICEIRGFSQKVIFSYKSFALTWKCSKWYLINIEKYNIKYNQIYYLIIMMILIILIIFHFLYLKYLFNICIFYLFTNFTLFNDNSPTYTFSTPQNIKQIVRIQRFVFS